MQMQRRVKCSLRLLKLFLIFFLSVSLASPSYLYAGQPSNLKITTSDFEACLEKVETCNKGYEKLEDKFHDCVSKCDRPKLFWIFDAETVAWIAVAFVAGKIF